MGENIKVKYDFGLKVLEYEGSFDLFDDVLEKISRVERIEGATSGTKNRKPNANANPNPQERGEGKKKPSKKSKSTKVSAEKFDIYGDGVEIPKLSEFFEMKKPAENNAEKIAVIAYYITNLLGKGHFSDGQIEFAFKMLGLKRPNHLRQIITNAKNQKYWFEKVDDSLEWELDRAGELFVADDLPRAEEN